MSVKVPLGTTSDALRTAVSTTDKYSTQQITWIHAWTPKLFSFKLTRPKNFRFTPGQWARIGVRNAHQPEQIIWRAYSIVSANYDDYLEFYSIVVPNGAFTSQLSQLAQGDEVLLEHQPYGFLTTGRFSGGRDLWMLSTGTGIAPFISILHDPDVWQQYQHLILVHSVRDADELAFNDTVTQLRHHPFFGDYCNANPNTLIYIPCVTREPNLGSLQQRITDAIRTGALESAAGLNLDLNHSRIMICGNPDMVDETRATLKDRGFTVSRQAKPGQIAVENYW